MNGLPLLTAALLVMFAYAIAMEPNGSIRMAIARWSERKANDIRRVVRQLDNSQTKIEPNDPYVVHRLGAPLTRDATSENIWSEKFAEPGTHTFSQMFTKKISTTWTWSRQHNLDYVLNVTQPVKDKVPDNSLVRVESLHKDFWEFTDPLPWGEAQQTCRDAGLKLAQPKTGKEVKHLQKVLHNRIHNRESGCHNEDWVKFDGYCFSFIKDFKTREKAKEFCESLNSTLPLPALGDATAWKQAVADYMVSIDEKSSDIHAGASQAPDGQWLWDDGTNVQDDVWAGGQHDEDECSILDLSSGIGKLHDRRCSLSYKTVCQGYSSNHWLGALGSDDSKCIEWVNGKCIEIEDTDRNSNITDLWRNGQPGDDVSSNYALLLQIEHENPFNLMKTTMRRPFLCESACPLGFVNFGPQCLLVQKVWLTWREAHSECQKNGLQLYETKDTSTLAKFLGDQKDIGSYWIGGSERKSIRSLASLFRKVLDVDEIKKLPFICELPNGSRQMNVSNQLSYKDQERVHLPKVVTTSTDCIVTVKERTIAETYPYSVQMAITGWIWLRYHRPSDEHGGYHCDNNNDWVGGEDCFAHSKWGYSTSYLHDGDQIIADGDNARLTLNGTVTYIYNEYEVSTCGSNRESRSVSERRMGKRIQRSIAPSKKYDIDDDSKPLMSSIGKRAGEWVRALARERKAHLVAYTIDQLSPTVTNLKIEKEFSELSSPDSIFEEEFENRGSFDVITTFAKIKNVVNSYRWSVTKGLSVEDSHVTSFTNTNSQSISNTFSLSNNLALTEGSTQSITQDNSISESISQGSSDSESTGSTNTQEITNTEGGSTGETISTGTSISESVGSTDGTSVSISDGSTSGTSVDTGVSNTITAGTSDSTGTNQDLSTTNTVSGSLTDTAQSSQSSTHGVTQGSSTSNTNSQSGTQSETESSTSSIGTSVEASASVSAGGFGVSVEASLSTSLTTNHESTKSSESSFTSSNEFSSSKEQSIQNEQTSSQDQSTAIETGHSTDQSSSSGINTNKEITSGNDSTTSLDTSITDEITQTNESTNNQEVTSNTEVGGTVDNSINIESNHGTEQGTIDETSINTDITNTYDNTVDEENRFGSDNSTNRESQKTYESSHGGDKSRDSQNSQETQKTRSKTVNMDENEEVETTEEETLETTNEVTIPPNTRVKIEWRVEKRTVRLPWKASVHLTGWINVRLKNNDKVCDTYHPRTGWNYAYNSTCEKDNRLYGYPLSSLKDKNFIQQGDGLRFVTSGVFEGVGVTSHYLRVTETILETQDGGARSAPPNDYQEVSRRKRNVRGLPSKATSKVTDYHLNFDDHGNGRLNNGKNNRHFRKFHAKKKFKKTG